MPFRDALGAELRRIREGLEPAAVTLFLIAGMSLCVYHYFGNDDFFNDHILHRLPWSDVRAYYLRCLYWCFSPFATLVLLPQLAFVAARLFLPPEPAPITGVRLGDFRIGATACAIFYGVALVLVAIVSRTKDFQHTYPLCVEAKHSVPFFVFYEFAYLCYFVAWESFFRGFLVFGLEKRLGAWAAFVQMLPFVVIHFDKPVLEAMSSVFGGVALGFLALRTRSFLYAAFIHAAMAITLDLLVVGQTGLSP